MKSPRLVRLAVTSLVLTASMTGCTTSSIALRSASVAADPQARLAAREADAARRALIGKNTATAIAHAEHAVSSAPRDAGYRQLLAQAYQSAGRFVSAESAYADTLALMPDNGRAALSLALAQIARGKSDVARTTLADYADRIGASDYGLALALAGDAPGAVRTLEAVVRAGHADAKTRQNLALAYALSGSWLAARTMAAQDLGIEAANMRILEWAQMVPAAPLQKVATLLGVTPQLGDPGQPAQLALAPGAAPARVAGDEFPADAAPRPVLAAATPAPAAPPAQPAPVFEVAAPVVAARTVAAPPIVTASPHRMAPLIRAQAQPARRAIAITAPDPYRPVSGGKFVVQLGAYDSVGVAQDAWRRAAARYRLGNYEPANAGVTVRGVSFVRLSVGGFASHGEATQLCARVRARGGSCFVRGLLTDQPARWVRQGQPRLASR